MTHCFFVSDLHGHTRRYETLFSLIADEQPGAVFLGGDLLPPGLGPHASTEKTYEDFIGEFLAPRLEHLKSALGPRYPRFFVILGNDDPRTEEAFVVNTEKRDLWEYVHNRRVFLGDHAVYGYAYISPSPFLLKDWERYDVSRYTDPGCVSPEQGHRSVPVSESEARHATIQNDLEELTQGEDLSRAILLFHTPPYQTHLDRAGLDGKTIDGVPLDLHVGSIAVRRFIEARQPLVTLHGHVHESARLTGSWRDRIARTHLFTAAHDGPELSLVRFTPHDLGSATREII